MRIHTVPVRLRSALVVPALLLLAACGLSPTAGGGPSPVPTAPATTAPATSCDEVPGMQGAQSAEILNTDLQGGMGIATSTITSPTSVAFQVVRYNVCVQVYPAGTVGNISAPIVTDTSSATAETVEALNLKGRGWAATTKFPFDGTTPTQCTAAQLCYTGIPAYYLELERIADHGHGVLTFTVRLAEPQPLVRCDPQLFPYDTYPAYISPEWNAAIPLPPATRVSEGYGVTEGLTTYLCSAGTIASIQAFMNQHLPSYGWAPVTINGTRLWKAPSGGGPIYMRINPITDPHRWSILEYFAGANLG